MKNPLNYPSCYLISCFLLSDFSVFACTGIRLQAEDSSVIYARTLEWRKNLNPYVIFVPTGTHYQGTSGDNKPGLSWTSIYAFTGITIGERPLLIDGMNQHGLAGGVFSFRDDVEYGIINENRHHDLAPWELITYLLSMYSSVQEVKMAVHSINVVPVFLEDVDEIPPLHYILHDSAGECIVLEHYKHRIKIYENPLGTITNSPEFDWHLTNLYNYLNPSFDAHKTYNINQLKTLHESYALGLPSDFSSPARFLRAAVYSQCAPTPSTGLQGVLQAFHILNQFDIPKGSFRTHAEDYFTYTHWTSAADLKEKKYYFRTYENQRIRMINLTTMTKGIKNIEWILMNKEEDIQDITPSIK